METIYLGKSRTDFEQLQSHWYQKLKEDGFEDIETSMGNSSKLKAWHSVYFHARHSPENFAFQEEYYRRASIFLEDYSFSSHLEEEIWRYHTYGFSIRDTAKDLQTMGFKINKDQINQTLQELAYIMRFYPLEMEELQIDE